MNRILNFVSQCFTALPSEAKKPVGEKEVQLLIPAPGKTGGISGRKFGLLVVLLPALAILTGCESINVNRLAYDFLRQEDCRRNDVDVYEFCSRTFVFEYDEYEKLRQEYIRTEAERFALEESNRLALQNAAWH